MKAETKKAIKIKVKEILFFEINSIINIHKKEVSHLNYVKDIIEKSIMPGDTLEQNIKLHNMLFFGRLQQVKDDINSINSIITKLNEKIEKYK